MIFPDILTKNWLLKYPSLTIEEGRCNSCGKPLLTTVPFIEHDYVGLVSPKCSCGLNTNQAMTMIATSKNEIKYWNKIVN